MHLFKAPKTKSPAKSALATAMDVNAAHAKTAVTVPTVHSKVTANK
jgi:hypothetical protein